jgi:GTP-binding protein Era
MVAAAQERLAAADLALHLHPAAQAPAPPLQQLARLEHPPRAPILIVYTQADLAPPERVAELGPEPIVVSATTGAGLERLLAEVRARLPEREFEFDPDDISTQPVRFFVVEYLREAAFDLLKEELPYAFTAEVEEFRETERPMYIRVTLFVERESQKPMVIGRGGQTLRAIGQQARIRLEELVQSPVYLDLWVKTLPKWRRSPAALARFGFPTVEEVT